MTMRRIARVSATGSSNVLEMTSIPGTYTDLLIKYSFRSTLGTYFVDGNYFRVNGNSANYSWRRMWNVASSSGSGSSMSFGLIGGSSTTANCFTVGEMYIPNYAQSVPKSFSYDTSTETNTTVDGNYMMIYAGLWNDNTAISSITFTLNGGNYASGSFIELYGITKGSSNGVTVS